MTLSTSSGGAITALRRSGIKMEGVKMVNAGEPNTSVRNTYQTYPISLSGENWVQN
jgi:hypothetical protein